MKATERRADRNGHMYWTLALASSTQPLGVFQLSTPQYLMEVPDLLTCERMDAGKVETLWQWHCGAGAVGCSV